MKQIPLLQGKALLVEMPKQDFIKAKMQTLVDMRTVWSGKMNFKSGDGWESVSLPPGNWRIIGMLSEVTEGHVFDLVDWYHVSDNMDLTATYAFKDYVNGEDDAENYWDEYMMDTAIESLESAVLAEGWYFENPYGEEPTHLEHMRAGWMDNPITNDVRRVWNWKEAQSRVIDRSRCLLLGREE